MELVLTGRGTRVNERLRQVTEHKLTRLEVEVVHEKNPRQGGAHRVEAVATTPRKAYRAHADARDVESALDVVVERLERQIRDHHEKRRARLIAGASRVKSAQTPGGSSDREARSAE